jgi:hypothetical protein
MLIYRRVMVTTSWLVGLVSFVAKIHLFDGEVPDEFDQSKRISTKLWLYIHFYGGSR